MKLLVVGDSHWWIEHLLPFSLRCDYSSSDLAGRLVRPGDVECGVWDIASTRKGYVIDT